MSKDRGTYGQLIGQAVLADKDTYEVCVMCNKEFEDGFSRPQATICETCKAEFKQMKTITQAVLKLNFIE